jgi:hypothetical protein
VTAGDDYQDEMSNQRSTAAHNGDPDIAVELLLSGIGDSSADAALVALLGDLRQLAHGAAPPLNEDLAALLDQGLPALGIARRRARRRKIATGLVLGGIASFGVAGVAAANDRLPGGAQGVMSRVVNDLTPFHVDNRAPVVPTAPSSTPARHPAAVPSGHPSPAAPPVVASEHPRNSSSPSHGDDESKPTHSPTPEPSETGGDTHGSAVPSGPDREPSDPAMSPRPSRTTGNGTEGDHSSPGPTSRTRDH